MYVASMDVGGTSLSSAVVRNDGFVPPESVHHQSIDSNGERDYILEMFAYTLNKSLEYAKKEELELSGAGISICGPFDYQQGISQIRDLDKYESIYGVNVKQSLKEKLGLHETFKLVFDVDAWCFARGEAWQGSAKSYQNVIVFTLGTGVGSAFVKAGMVVDEGEGVPWLGWIAGQSYKDSILNDYLSRPYIMKAYQRLTGQSLDVKEIAEEAQKGSLLAQQIFSDVATELATFIKDRHVTPFNTDCIVLGGQIAKAFPLYKEPLWAVLQDVPTLKAIVPASDITLSALRGAAKLLFDQAIHPFE